MSVPIEDAQATFAATVVDEWVRAGVLDAVLCPGSRSTPLAIALGARADLRVHVRLDERGAAFFALGLALATGRPPILCTTSGTAAAELHAGVAEASHASVPLIVCTADRPARLHHVGAPQTIEQSHLYGSALRWFADPGPLRREDGPWWRWFARSALEHALSEPPGPVQLNLAFDEPLVGTPAPLPPPLPDPFLAPRGRRPVDTGPGVRWRSRGIVVAGAGAGSPARLVETAQRLGWPLLADPRSGARVAAPGVVAAADAFLRDPEVAAALRPETVLLLGRPWASKVLGEFVQGAALAGAEVVAVADALSDPGRVVSSFYDVAPGAFLDQLAAVEASPPPGWAPMWTSLEAAAQRAIDQQLAADPLCAGDRATEPSVARHLFRSLDADTLLFVGSSMPVRDLEWYGAPRVRPPRVLANRGANGIDGLVSTALGLAASAGAPVVALVGDLAFCHDLSGLVSVGDELGACTVVVLDNHGGGIFNFLAQATELEPEQFERLFATPPSSDLATVARGLGAEVSWVAGLAQLDRVLERAGEPGRRVAVVSVPHRSANVALHERIHRAVAARVLATAATLGRPVTSAAGA